jgi:hypothetical protein
MAASSIDGFPARINIKSMPAGVLPPAAAISPEDMDPDS